MAIIVASANTLSLTAGSKSAEQVTGDNQYVNRGKLQLVCKASAAAATGIRVSLTCAGISLANDQMVSYAGTTGSLSVRDNMIVDQNVQGGRVSLSFRNDSAGTLTIDYLLLFTLM